MFGFKRKRRPEIIAPVTEPTVAVDSALEQGKIGGQNLASNASGGTNPIIPPDAAFREPPETPAEDDPVYEDWDDCNPSHRKDQRLKIRFTPQEYAHVRRCAADAGVDCSKYIRAALNAFEVERTPMLDFAALRQKLGPVGMHVNDVLVRARSLGFIDVPELRSALEECSAVFEEIYRPYREHLRHEKTDL